MDKLSGYIQVVVDEIEKKEEVTTKAEENIISLTIHLRSISQEHRNDLKALNEDAEQYIERMISLLPVTIVTNSSKFDNFRSASLADNSEVASLNGEIDHEIVPFIEYKIRQELESAENMSSNTRFLENSDADIESSENLEEVISQNVEEEVSKRESEIESKWDEKISTYDELRERLNDKESEYEGLIKELQNKREELEQSVERANTLEERAEELRSNISSIGQDQVDSRLGGQFKKRKEELEDSLKFWRYLSGVSISVLVIISILIYIDITRMSQSGSIMLSKIALILPLSVPVWFCVSNYMRSKQMVQEYEFKINMALTFETYRDRISDEQDEVSRQFVSQTVEKIYSNPQQNISGNSDQEGEQSLTTAQAQIVDLFRKLGRR